MIFGRIKAFVGLIVDVPSSIDVILRNIRLFVFCYFLSEIEIIFRHDLSNMFFLSFVNIKQQNKKKKNINEFDYSPLLMSYWYYFVYWNSLDYYYYYLLLLLLPSMMLS